jgi:hypothetical protein
MIVDSFQPVDLAAKISSEYLPMLYTVEPASPLTVKPTDKSL